MPFPLEHWRDPRGTIACTHKDDDMAYMLHGAQMAAYALRFLNLRPSVLQGMTCIDYGCGTGRIARVLASHFKHVFAYDPQPACMAAAKKECQAIPIHNLTFGLPSAADVAVCVNVLEHLDTDRCRSAIDDMLTRCQLAVVWYDPTINGEAIAPRLQRGEIDAALSSGKRIHIAVIRR